MDYSGVNKDDEKQESKPEKKIEKVVVGEVIVQKRTLGRKIRDLFIEADLRSVTRYIVAEVLLPAFRNTIVDASTKGIERVMYGEPAMRRRGYSAAPRVTYNNPINRGYRESERPQFRADRPTSRPAANVRNDFVLATRDEAEEVLEGMSTIIDKYDVVSVADLHELMGIPSTYTDNSWGWSSIIEAQVRQIREGYLLDLPRPEQLN